MNDDDSALLFSLYYAVLVALVLLWQRRERAGAPTLNAFTCSDYSTRRTSLSYYSKL